MISLHRMKWFFVQNMFYANFALIYLPDIFTEWNGSLFVQNMFYANFALIYLPDIFLWKTRMIDDDFPSQNEMVLYLFKICFMPTLL